MKNIAEIRNKWFVDKVNDLKSAGISYADMALRMGVLPQYLNSIMKGKRNASEKFVLKFCEEFDINHNDLLNRLKRYHSEDTPKTGSEPNISKLKDYETGGIPLIPISAMAGFGEGETQVLIYDCEWYIIPLFKDAEFLIQVKGSSMHPKYSSGDVVGCRKVPLTDIFFQWNKVYVLDTAQGALIKRVKPGRDDNHIILVSENEKYEPFELSKQQINAVAIVVGVIRLE